MVWMYLRGSESLRVETRFDNETNEYVLIVYREDGTQQGTRFKDATLFKTRFETLEKHLDRDRWQTDGGRLLRDGWKI